MKKLYFTLTVLLTFGFSISLYAEDIEKTIYRPLPKVSNLLKTNTYYCKAIVSSYIQALTKNEQIPGFNKGVRGGVYKGNDEFFVKIDKDKVHIASNIELMVDGGFGGSQPFRIIHNDDENLVATAIDTSDIYKYIGVFYINKKNGLAIWNKTQSHLKLDSCPINFFKTHLLEFVN